MGCMQLRRGFSDRVPFGSSQVQAFGMYLQALRGILYRYLEADKYGQLSKLGFLFGYPK